MIERQLSNTLSALDIHYGVGSDVDFNTIHTATADGYEFKYQHILDRCKDIKINNYSCLFATDTHQNDNIITHSISTQKKFITSLKKGSSVLTYDANTGNIALKPYTDINDNCIFEVSIDGVSCVISHTHENNVYYMTNINTNNNVASNITYCSGIIPVVDDNILLLLEDTYPGTGSDTIQYSAIVNVNNNIDYNSANMRYDTISGGVLQSYKDQQNNMLVDIQYYNYDNLSYNCNVLHQNNHKTYSNRTTFSNYWDTQNLTTVNSIQTGTRQEFGNTNVYNIQDYYMHEYIITPGKNIIKTPDTLYPFESIDINDTKFVECGAIGGISPAVADKIYIDRYPTTDNNKILLCAWLSSNETDSIWVDRYYNPTMFDINRAYNTKAHDIIFDLYEQDNHLYQFGFFDKQSDIAFTPSQTFTYYRTTQEDLHGYINQLDSHYLSTIICKDITNFNTYTTNNIVCDGSVYGSVELNTNITNYFTVSMDVDMYDWYDNAFYDLFTTNSNNCGVRLFKNNDLTPVLISYAEKTVYILNTKFECIDKFDVEYDIRRIHRYNPLQYLIIEFDEYINIYTLFGGLIKSFKVGDNSSSCVGNDYLYIANDNDNVVSSINLNTFEASSTKFAHTAHTLAYGNNKLFYSDKHISNYEYIDNIGVLYINKDNDPSNKDNDSSNKDNDSFKLAYYNSDNTYMGDDNTSYVSIRRNIYIDEETNIEHYDTQRIIDFKVYGKTLYFITNSHLYVGGVMKQDIQKYQLPIISDDVSIVITSEIENAQFTQHVYVIAEYKRVYNIYEFKNNEFKFIKTLSSDLNGIHHEMLSPSYIKPPTHDITLEITFKLEDNKNLRFSKIVNAIHPGKHTLALTVDTISQYCKLYVDDELKCGIDLNKDNLLFQYDITQQHLVLGNTLLYNGGDLASYTNNTQWFVKNVEIGNIYLYNTTLSQHDIFINSIKNIPIAPISLTLPCGQREKITKINSLSKQTTPGYKSKHFDIMIKNLRLSKSNQTKLNAAIKSYIESQLPAATNLDEIVYKDY